MAAGSGPTDRVREEELLPELFRLADSASALGQRLAVTLARWQLVLLITAAAAGAVGRRSADWLAAAACLGAAGLAARLGRRQPQALWYEGRAAAESVKTLAWKYAVRADAYQPPPQQRQQPTQDAEGAYRRQLDGLLAGFGDGAGGPGAALPAGAAGAAGPAAVTTAMRELREQPLAVRRAVYLRERVAAQRDWYRAKAAYCGRAGRATELLGVALPLLGLALAVCRALGALPVDALGPVATLAAAVTAWAQLRQYRPLAAAYRLAAGELDQVTEQLGRLDPGAAGAEELWARLARDAEDAVSREHTTWQARRELRPDH
ncbi:DUF4231 domain-containing protein [Kitasatospora viridis]|uniref:Uncharacterized protein DUF4231 n=1 Tax=Kitasatospora viridis TaxID=281105 RepID=A0A561UGA1_9ACTN|nr:DUF4231 domain-containing protein [Kitasatospora viridis]TWF98397.1 uncharacterized protein DUF4231 [Kitasatospora viridis]